MNFGSYTDTEETKEAVIQELTYMNYFGMVNNFISLDPSKNGTGWARYRDGKLETGRFSIQSEDEQGARKEYRLFIESLFEGREYEYLFIEDTIGSVNYKTARILYQLNLIPDELIDYDRIKVGTLVRENNSMWKGNLRLASNYNPKVRGEVNDKEQVQSCLQLLGFGDGTTDSISEDEYDAVGSAVGIIYRLFVLKKDKTKVKLKTDISKGYKLMQFEDEYDANEFLEDFASPSDIEVLDYMTISRDLKSNFAKHIKTREDDTRVYVIKLPTAKMGVVALSHGLDLNSEETCLVVHRKDMYKKKRRSSKSVSDKM